MAAQPTEQDCIDGGLTKHELDDGRRAYSDGTGQYFYYGKPIPAPQSDSTSDTAIPGTNKPKKKSKSDYAVAMDTLETFGRPLAYQAGRFWAFYKEIGWIEADNAVMRQMNERRGRSCRGGVYEIAASHVAIPERDQTGRPTLYWEWNGTDWKPLELTLNQILFTDVIYDLDTDEYEELGNRAVYGPMINAPYLLDDDESAPRCAIFEQLIKMAFPDNEIRRHFQEVVSTVLQPHSHMRSHIVLWGPTHTGKTTIATAIACAAAGAVGASFESEYDLSRSKWAASSLVNKFANVSNDSDLTPRWENWMKRYTSGVLMVERKFRQRETVVITAKLISTCNELQPYVDASGASNRRLIPFHLSVPIEAKCYPIQTQIMTPAFWSNIKTRAGVLEWLREGLIRLRKRGKFDTPESYKQSKMAAVAQANPVEDWLLDNVVADKDGFIPTADLLRRIELGEESPKSFAMKLPRYLDRLFGATKLRKRTEAGNFNGYTGVKWNEE